MLKKTPTEIAPAASTERDIRALKRAFKHLGLDHRKLEDRERLCAILKSGALDEPRKRGRGRRKGSKARIKKWNPFELAFLGMVLKLETATDPRLSDAELAELLAPAVGHTSAETLRKRFAEARRTVENFSQDVLMNMNMTEAEGEEVIRRLRALEEAGTRRLQWLREAVKINSPKFPSN